MGNTAGYYAVTNETEGTNSAFSPSYKTVKRFSLKKFFDNDLEDSNCRNIKKVNVNTYKFDSSYSKSNYFRTSSDPKGIVLPGFSEKQFKQKRRFADSKNYSQSAKYLSICSTPPKKSAVSLDNLSLPDDPYDTKVTYPFEYFTNKERPYLYSSSGHSSDWRLGTILEESGETTIKRRCRSTDSEFESMVSFEKYDSSGDDDCVLIGGSYINIKDIQAERDKEADIQKSLERYESLERIERCLTASGKSDDSSKTLKYSLDYIPNKCSGSNQDIYTPKHYISEYHYTTFDPLAKLPEIKAVKSEDTSQPKQPAEVQQPERRQSSIDAPKVIEKNPEATYIRFGSGLEADVDFVISSSQASIDDDISQLSSFFNEETSKSQPCLDLDNSLHRLRDSLKESQLASNTKFSLPEGINWKSDIKYGSNPFILSLQEKRRHSTDDILKLNKDSEPDNVGHRWHQNFFKSDHLAHNIPKKTSASLLSMKRLSSSSNTSFKNSYSQGNNQNKLLMYRNRRYTKSADFAGKMNTFSDSVKLIKYKTKL